MNITINGENRRSEDDISVLDLLNELKIEKDRVAVELNATIVARADLGHVMLKEADRLEIVTFVGGG